MNKPLVSVIIVSYNTREYTVKAINSVFSSQGFRAGEIEVIVIDNNSPDDTVSYIKKHLHDVVVISNNENHGFGGGNNQGAAIAKGQYLLFLNSDAFLSPNSLKVMVDILAKRKEVVSVGPQLRYLDGSLQPSCGYLPTPVRVTAWMWWLDKIPVIKKLFKEPYHIFDLEWYKVDQYPDWLMGACIMFRKDEFLEVGGFDDKIFMYSEEVELYRRLLDSTAHVVLSHQRRVFFTTSTFVTHIGSISTKKAGAYRLTFELQGINYIYKKYYPNMLWYINFVIKVGVLMRIIIFSLIPNRRDTLVEYKKYWNHAI